MANKFLSVAQEQKVRKYTYLDLLFIMVLQICFDCLQATHPSVNNNKNNKFLVQNKKKVWKLPPFYSYWDSFKKGSCKWLISDETDFKDLIRQVAVGFC